MGLMLAGVSLGAFANNADEEKKVSTIMEENSALRSTSTYVSMTVDMLRGDVRDLTIPIDVGYRTDGRIEVVGGDSGCVTWNNLTRSLVIRLVAQYRGYVILRIKLFAIDAPGINKTIDIIVNVEELIGRP